MKRIFLLILVAICIVSCKSIVISLFGNKIIDTNYNAIKKDYPFSVEIPFNIEDGFITIKAKVNNSEKEYNFIFDTGALSMISEEVAKDINFQKEFDHSFQDSNGVFSSGITNKIDLTIGNLVFKGLRVDAAKTNLFDKDCENKFDGIIGSNILNQGYFYFNNATKKLIISNIYSRLPDFKKENKLKIKRKLSQPYVKLKNNKNIWCLLDTGFANGYIETDENSKFISKNLKPFKQLYLTSSSINSEKIIFSKIYKDKLKIGKTEVLADIMQTNTFKELNILGNKIFQNNDFIIDIPHKTLYIPSVLNDKAEIIKNITFKFKNNLVLINSLAKNDIIDKKGFKVNDTIISINNYQMNTIKNECEFKEYLNLLKENDYIIEVIDNKKIKKHLIKYHEIYE